MEKKVANSEIYSNGQSALFDVGKETHSLKVGLEYLSGFVT